MTAAIRVVLTALGLYTATLEAQRPVADSRAVWYDHRLVRDLAGDGRPDTLRVVARGHAMDSQHVVLTIRGVGHQLFRDEWSTQDDFRDYQLPADSTGVSRDSLARIERNRLNAIFDLAGFEPVSAIRWRDEWPPVWSGCDGDPRDCIAFYLRYERDTLARVRRGLPAAPSEAAEYEAFLARIDSAQFDTSQVRRLAAEIRRSKAPTFSFSYGYETTRTIIWSPSARRFLPIFECC